MSLLEKINSIPGLGLVMNTVKTIKSIPGLVEKIVENGVDKGFSIVESEWTRYRNVEEELERLRRTSARITSLLTDAEERRYIEDETVRNWLRDLKSVSFDTDDLLDKYQTALSVHKRKRKRKRKFYEIELGPELGPFQRRRFSSEINKIDNRLDEIAKSQKTLRLSGSDGPRREPAQRRTALFQPRLVPDNPVIIDRENEIDDIVKLLTSDQTSRGPRVVPIHGSPGIGKTTLARFVFDDSRVHDHFDFQAWAWLTDRSDTISAMKEICEKMTNQRCDLQQLDALQIHLRDSLNNRKDNKFLLVIDNLWIVDIHFWEVLRVPLLAGAEGSKVLITTRNKKTCQTMSGLIPQPSLNGLSAEECWQLIKSLALPQDISDHDNENLVQIGKEIAMRCNGSPMAAKAIGAALNERNEEEWSDVLTEMRALNADQNGAVLAGLKISYHHLPYHLKQCFSYCSIFSNSYVFERDQVIRCWLAEGLIEPEGRRRLEAVGTKYFDELLWRSFFEKVPISDKKSQVERYRMPSLMRELAMLISEYEFRCLESGKNQPEPKRYRPDQARYASFLQPKNKKTVNIECLEPYSHLRTLKFSAEFGDEEVPLNSIPAPFFRMFTYLRVLDMSNSNLELVSDSVGELFHLRYLGLSNTPITTLPEKICDLFNLQTLELKGCLKLAQLPKGLGRLINLRHLDLHLDWDQEIKDSTEVAIPQGIGELEELQTLSRFNVASPQGQDCNINELKHLNLRGDLCLLNLEKVPTAGDAENANLKEKKFVENLMLRWHSSDQTNQLLQEQSEKVINSLMPSNRLRCLWIVNYPGTNFPDWIGDPSFSSLQTIRISKCNNFNFLSPLGKLPRLKYLQIGNVPKDTMSMPAGFPSLEHLILLNLSSLVKLYLENEIPRLQEIHVFDCLGLQELVIHRDLHDKFKSRNCPHLIRVTPN